MMEKRAKYIHKNSKPTEKLIVDCVADSTKIMIKKSRMRGDAWRGSGLLGQFIEIYSMFKRLRSSIWEQSPDVCRHRIVNDPDWKADILNSLQDMRNFTVLAELCLREDNFDGSVYPDLVDIYKCDKCGRRLED